MTNDPLALAAATNYLGEDAALDRVFTILEPSGDQKSIGELAEATRKMGLFSSAVRWKRGYAESLPCPAIIRVDPQLNDGAGHFLVILSHHLGSYLILDPPNEPTWITAAELWKTWDGPALHIARRPDLLPRRDQVNLKSVLTVTGVGLMGLSCLLLLPRKQAEDIPADRSPLPKRSNTIPLQMACTVSITFLAASYLISGPFPWAGQRPVPRLMDQLVEKRIDASTAADPELRVPFRFRLLNPQPFDVKVENIVTSCGCAAPSLATRTVKAGQATEIIIQVKPPEKASTPRTFDFIVSFDEPSRNPPVSGRGIFALE